MSQPDDIKGNADVYPLFIAVKKRVSFTIGKPNYFVAIAKGAREDIHAFSSHLCPLRYPKMVPDGVVSFGWNAGIESRFLEFPTFIGADCL
jgi:hypothetical protein